MCHHVAANDFKLKSIEVEGKGSYQCHVLPGQVNLAIRSSYWVRSLTFTSDVGTHFCVKMRKLLAVLNMVTSGGGLLIQ